MPDETAAGSAGAPGGRGHPGLTPKDFQRARRDRRLGRTVDLQTEVTAWATQRGFTLRVLNDGHHWLLQKPGLVAEWWPSSAKLVLKREKRQAHPQQMRIDDQTSRLVCSGRSQSNAGRLAKCGRDEGAVSALA